jgi:hypothetical protein
MLRAAAAVLLASLVSFSALPLAADRGSEAVVYSDIQGPPPPADEPLTPARMPSGAPEIIYKKATCYGQLVQWYLDLAAKHPDYIETFYANQKYGHGGVPGAGAAACAPQPGNPYDLIYVRITNEKLGLRKPEVFFGGPPHGDEKAGAQVNYWFSDWMMRTAFDPQYADAFWTPRLLWYLDNREIYLTASQNPYGYDSTVRGDVDGDDLNRETDYDCCGATQKGIFGSVNGKTIRDFWEKHQIRTGIEWHGGTRALLHSFSSTHNAITAVSPISGRTTTFAPPDFFYYNVGMHRLGEYIGTWGGTLGAAQIGTSPDVLGYQAPGSGVYYYASDTAANPVESPYVKQGPYKGPGGYRVVFEISTVKDISESQLGGDITKGFGIEGRRAILFFIDVAQPYVTWANGTPANNSQVKTGEPITLAWVVNGALAADSTSVQYGTDPDPVKNPQQSTKAKVQFFRKHQGGTLWDAAKDGKLTPYVWTETVTLTQPGDYYFTAKSMVDQIYDTVAGEAEYGKNHTYLRSLKERIQEGWTETINGEDGPEVMTGRKWWHSPVLKLTATGGPVQGPVITTTSPGNGAVNVPAASKIEMTWSKGMDKSSAEGAFAITPAAAGAWAWGAGDTVQTLAPASPLANDTKYTVTVNTSAKDSGGTPTPSVYSFSFTTAKGGGNQSDTTPPTVIMNDPADGAANVALDKTVSITFSEPMDTASVEGAFSIKPARGMAFSWSGNVLSARPDLKYDKGRMVEVSVGISAKDVAGNALAKPHTFSFKTEGEGTSGVPPLVKFTNPPDKSTGVALSNPIEVGFTQEMSAASLTNAFAISPAISFTVQAQAALAMLKYGGQLKAGTKYTVTVSKEVASTEGIIMGAPYVFTFTTGDGSGPPAAQGPTTSINVLPFLLIGAVMIFALAAVAALFARRKRKMREWQQSNQQQMPPQWGY